MEFNHGLLIYRIRKIYGGIPKFAEAIHSVPNVVYRKLANDTGITREEIIKWSEALDIPLAEIAEYFLNVESN